jgi:hypothetical protein
VEEDNTDFIANERLAIMNASLQECWKNKVGASRVIGASSVDDFSSLLLHIVDIDAIASPLFDYDYYKALGLAFVAVLVRNESSCMVDCCHLFVRMTHRAMTLTFVKYQKSFTARQHARAHFLLVSLNHGVRPLDWLPIALTTARLLDWHHLRC